MRPSSLSTCSTTAVDDSASAPPTMTDASSDMPVGGGRDRDDDPGHDQLRQRQGVDPAAEQAQALEL